MRNIVFISTIFLYFICKPFSLVYGQAQQTGQQSKPKSSKMKTRDLIGRIFELFENGEYEEVDKTLDIVQSRISKSSKKAKKIQGLIYYWKAMSAVKLSDYDKAEEYFIKALDLKYFTKDIYYEYGQVLYVANKYKRARIAFKKSVRKKYKIGVSIYYIAFISQELKDYKKAVSFYKMIEKLSSDEKKDVLQAARMQVGDIYLLQIERQRDPFKGVEKYVIPQYEKALGIDENSRLADDIREKIIVLQRRYELILFKMRNGRPTSRPPYYVKANLLYGQNDNVTVTSEANKQTLDTKDYSSPYYQVGFFGRYSIYPNSVFSYAPELSAQYTKYNSDSTSILPYNSYFIKSALKVNYEHLYKQRPATLYIDFDYTYNADDSDADTKMAARDAATGVSFSEQIPLWQSNPTTFRFRYESVKAEVTTNSNKSIAFNLEQIVLLPSVTLYWFNSYSSKTYAEAETSNANTLTSRMDFIFPTFFSLFNPTPYVSITNTTYIKDTDRGTPSLLTYGLNLNRPLGRRYFITLDYGISTQTADQDSDTYKQQLITLNLDYIY